MADVDAFEIFGIEDESSTTTTNQDQSKQHKDKDRHSSSNNKDKHRDGRDRDRENRHKDHKSGHSSSSRHHSQSKTSSKHHHSSSHRSHTKQQIPSSSSRHKQHHSSHRSSKHHSSSHSGSHSKQHSSQRSSHTQKISSKHAPHKQHSKLQQKPRAGQTGSHGSHTSHTSQHHAQAGSTAGAAAGGAGGGATGAMHGKPQTKQQQEQQRLGEFVCDISYRSQLPEPPLNPKFLKYPHSRDRYTKYNSTNLELNYDWQFHFDTLFPLSMDFMDPNYYFFQTAPNSGEQNDENKSNNQDANKDNSNSNNNGNNIILDYNNRYELKRLHHSEDWRICESIERRLSKLQNLSLKDSKMQQYESSNAFLQHTQYLSTGRDASYGDMIDITMDDGNNNGGNVKNRNKSNKIDFEKEIFGDTSNKSQMKTIKSRTQSRMQTRTNTTSQTQSPNNRFGRKTNGLMNLFRNKRFTESDVKSLVEPEFTDISNIKEHPRKKGLYIVEERLVFPYDEIKSNDYAFVQFNHNPATQAKKLSSMPRNQFAREKVSANATSKSLLKVSKRLVSENNPNSAKMEQYSLYANPRESEMTDNGMIVGGRHEWVCEYLPSNIENKGVIFAVVGQGNEIFYSRLGKKIKLRHKPTDASDMKMNNNNSGAGGGGSGGNANVLNFKKMTDADRKYYQQLPRYMNVNILDSNGMIISGNNGNNGNNGMNNNDGDMLDDSYDEERMDNLDNSMDEDMNGMDSNDDGNESGNERENGSGRRILERMEDNDEESVSDDNENDNNVENDSNDGYSD